MTRDFKVNNFDLLRLFAACEVVILHSFPRLETPYPVFFGILEHFPGVSMFFVISGFLISASLERNQNLKLYFKNRALRIFPALWVCLILTVPVIAVSANISFVNWQSIPWFVSQCFGIIYTPPFLVPFGFGSYNGSLWTIPLELQFYVALPFIYFVAHKLAKNEKHKSWLIFFTFIGFCVLTYFIKIHYSKRDFQFETVLQKVIRYTFVPNIFMFLHGVVLQRFKAFKCDFIFGKGLLWTAMYLVTSYYVPTNDSTYIFKLLFLGITTISLAYTWPKLSESLLRGNDISYGVYIYHGLVLGVFIELNLFHSSLYVFALFCITLLLATLSWIFVERPVLRRKKNPVSPIATVSIASPG